MTPVAAPGEDEEPGMFFHDELMRARQHDLLREAAHVRLAAEARRARRTVAAPTLARPRASRPEGRAL